jgi:hypothetical protein
MRAAFAQIVDYAGLFPPASCSMADAVRQYDTYRKSGDGWMLGRFVVAAMRLQEFAAAIAEGGVVIERTDPWHLSVVMGVHVPGELARIAAFGAEWEERGVFASAVELKVTSVGQVQVVGEQIPRAFVRYFEVPQRGPYDALLEAIVNAGARAKLRTGGTSPGLFPESDVVARFLVAATGCDVPFKATAGLHHPWRGDYPITYAADAPRERMHGFVNVLVATAEAIRSGDTRTVRAIVDESDRVAFAPSADGITWRDREYSVAELTTAHERGFVGFGSCSFREPVDELGLAAKV